MEQQKPSPPTFEAAVKWWKGLTPGNRAEVRRADSLAKIALTQGFHQLRQMMEGSSYGNIKKLALVAGVVAHIRNSYRATPHPNDPLGRQLGQHGANNDRAQMSGLRFRRLLEKKTPEDLLVPMIRAVRLIGQDNVNLGHLAYVLYHWNEKTRYRLAEDYYNTAPNEI